MLNESDHGNRKLPCSPTVIPSTEVLNQGALLRLPVGGLVHAGAWSSRTCCHPHCEQDQNLAICASCLFYHCQRHRYIKSQVNATKKSDAFTYLSGRLKYMHTYVYTHISYIYPVACGSKTPCLPARTCKRLPAARTCKLLPARAPKHLPA